MIYQEKFANKNLTLISVNLDNFKQLNRQFGLAHGDYVLAKIATIFYKLVGKNDNFARIGGDEYVIALADTELSSGLAFAEKLLNEIRSLVTTDDKILCSLTASCGVANTSLCNYVPKYLYADANKALLRAKRQGKDQVAAFTANMSNRAKYQLPDKLQYKRKKQ